MLPDGAQTLFTGKTLIYTKLNYPVLKKKCKFLVQNRDKRGKGERKFSE